MNVIPDLLMIASVVSEPTAGALPGNAQEVFDTVLGWVVTGGRLVALGTLMFIAIKVMTGLRRNGQTAADAIGTLPTWCGGAVLFVSATEITNLVLV